VVVLNTCTVTAEADRDARQTIRRIHRENPRAEVLVTGCYAQRSPQEVSALQGVKWVVGNSHKHEIGELIAPRLVQIDGALPQKHVYHGEIVVGATLVGDVANLRTVPSMPVGDPLGRSRPNIKLQDGCDNRCAFCVIPSVRGRSRSATAEAVIREIRALEDRFPEIVLTGINLGRWGRDLDGQPRLVKLLREILAETSVRRVRLSSVEPMDWSEDLIELMATSERIAQHVHIPLQSGSDAVLRRMRRRYRVRHYESRLALVRRRMPLAAIGADVMVGFPGETDEEFEHTREFVDRMPFTYLHVFSYSSRDGTEAAGMSAQVPKSVKRVRSRVLRELIDRKNLEFRRNLLGSTVSAVTLAAGEGVPRALSENFVEIHLNSGEAEPSALTRVRIESVEAGRTVGSNVGLASMPVC
jgi:threonylcarbamoyladenosine tRNA methylthiotransferase MtaB